MSLKYLGRQLDIHCGGIDHINIHHTNEIAQSEAATGKKFFDYWMHGAFLNVAGGKKMAKSADNFLTMENALLKKGIDPLAYRFAALQVHYRKPMEYSEDGLKQAEEGLDRLYSQFKSLGAGAGKVDTSYKEKFLAAINDDLNMPKAMAVVSAVLKAKMSADDKRTTLLDFDTVLGLGLGDLAGKDSGEDLGLDQLPAAIQDLVKRRQSARAAKEWELADNLRKRIESSGYAMEDTKDGYRLSKKKID